MRKLVVVVANTKNARTKSNYCNSKRNERKIVAKRMRLLRDLIT